LRERLDFSPPSDPDKRVKNTVEVEEIGLLRRRAARWRNVAVCGAAALAATIGIAVWFHVKAERRKVDTPPPDATVIALAAAPDSNLLPALAADMPGRNVSDFWGMRMPDRERQSARLGTAGGDPAILLKSVSRLPLLLRSASIKVEPGMSFRLEGSVLHGEDFKGGLSLVAVCSGGSTPAKSYAADPSMKRKGGWKKAQRSFVVPPGADTLEVRVSGDFSGSAALTMPMLVYRGRE
jgi:hypothetical protein